MKTRSFLCPPPAPHHNAAADCRRAVPYGAQGGEGVAEEGRGGPPEDAGVSANNLPAVCVSLASSIPALTPSRRTGGLGVVGGGGGRSRGLPAYFPEAPRAEGEGRQVGGRGRGGRLWRRGSRGQPYPRCWPTASEIESGSNRLFKLPECVLGEGNAPRRSGSDFSRFAPSPPGPHACPLP